MVLVKNGVDISESQLEAELVAMVRQEIGALACFKKAIIVKRLPKTRSGKILRKLLRQIATGSDYSVPSTIDDPTCLLELAELMQQKDLIGKEQ
jgi:propionyl-CoA synthetase